MLCLQLLASNKVFSEVLTSLSGDRWRQMRSTLSPVFTSGKLKAMNGMMQKVKRSQILNKYLKKYNLPRMVKSC